MTVFIGIAKKPISKWWAFLLQVLIYLSILAAFFLLKSTFKAFCLERIFRDTLSYVKVAEQPITSFGFWAAERPFTLPLLYKLLGVTSQNYELPGMMSQVSAFQTWFSSFCWIILGWAAALQFRSRWLKPLAFAVVLVFSTSLPVSFWDTLMLSESLSTSLFAMVCAGWLFWIWYVKSSPSSSLGWLLVALQVFITILYAFVRDSNIYFVVMGGLLVILGVLWQKAGSHIKRVQSILYGLALLVILLVSNINIAQGNRWQVFLYDQLALNILPDPAARDFFAQAGLPVDDKLMAITTMMGYKYQNLLSNAPEMAGVKQWVENQGKGVYLKYLFANGLNSLWEPLANARALISPKTTGYLYPRFPGLPYPRRIMLVSQIFYIDSLPFSVAIFVLVTLTSLLFWWRSGERISAWWFVLILMITMYPMMFLIWHGEPMEVDRHAAQLGIQLRLAAWLSLVLIIEKTWFARAVIFPQKNPPSS